MNPAPYSGTNTAELQAVVTFLALLDLTHIKPDVKWFDKVPNTDGQLEIVDLEQRPLGKLQVQVKKIPDGDTSFQCPVELIAYTERNSLPFILICVDVGNKKAYFRHLHRLMMPELKPDQKTFVVKFDSKIHSISGETQYLHQWTEIIEEYNKRVSDYPRLRQIESQLDLSHISKEDRIYFQEFTDHLNRLLETDFSFVKEQFFRGVWKLGVAVSSANSVQVCFQLYTIFPGDPDIRVTGISEIPPIPPQIPKDPKITSIWAEGGRANKTIEYNWKTRSALKSPKEEAAQFVFTHLKKMLQARSFSLYGKRLAVEYLFWFVDHYGQSLGIQVADRLNVAQLNYGVYVYLPAWGSLAVPRFLGELIKLNRNNVGQIAHVIAAPPFESIASSYPQSFQPTKEEVIRLIESKNDLSPIIVRFTEASMQLLMDAVDFLSSSNEEWINRPYIPRTESPEWIWSGYSAAALRHNIQSIIVDSLEEYRFFVEKNQIPIKNSNYLHGTHAFVYAANFEEWASAKGFGNCPILNSYAVKNEDGKLPKVTLIDLSVSPTELIVEKKNLKLRGLDREILGYGSQSASDFFKKLPMLNEIYDKLGEDLGNEYKYKFS